MKKKDKDLILKQLNNIDTIGELSDGYHTFDSLYHQRLVLFATLVNLNKDMCWKTKRHEDGEKCFGGDWFLVCIETPDGPYSYHYELKDWDMFECQEIDKAKPFDGHTDKDVERLLSLKNHDEKFYVIMKSSFEFGDPYSGSSEGIVFITRDKSELDKRWKNLVDKGIKWLEATKITLKGKPDADPELIDDRYKIAKHEDSNFEIYVDNWSYEWWFEVYDNDFFSRVFNNESEQ